MTWRGAWAASTLAAVVLLVALLTSSSSSSSSAPAPAHVTACKGYYEIAMRDFKSNALVWSKREPVGDLAGIPLELQESAWRVEMVLDLCFDGGGDRVDFAIQGPADVTRAIDRIERGWRASTIGGPWRMP